VGRSKDRPERRDRTSDCAGIVTTGRDSKGRGPGRLVGATRVLLALIFVPLVGAVALATQNAVPAFASGSTPDDILTIAGNGTAGAAGDGGLATSGEMDQPTALSLDKHGNILVTDLANNEIRVVARSSGTFYGTEMTYGDIYTVAGDGSSGYAGDGGAATSSPLYLPGAASVDAEGNLLIGDSYDYRVRVVAESSSNPGYALSGCSGTCSWTVGDIYTIAGDGTDGYSGDGGSADDAELLRPTAVVADPEGNILVADVGNSRIRVIAESDSNPGYPLAGCSPCTWEVGRIFTVAGNGTAGYSGDGGVATSAEFSYNWGMTIDSKGNVIIADNMNNRVRLLAMSASNPGYPLYCGGGSCTWTVGDIYSIAGDGTAGFSGDMGVATSAEIDGPIGVAVDSAGNVVFGDGGNNRVRVVALHSGTYYGVSMTAEDIYTLAGDGTSGYSGDGGLATSAELDDPHGVAVGPGGQLYLADTYSQRIRELYPLADLPVRAVGVGIGAGAGQTDDLAGVARHNTTCVRADPVNCASGDFTETATDESVPGRGPELDLTRTYNSLEASTEGIFGYGWTSSYEMNLVTNEDSSVTITAADGSQVTAEPDDDTYVMPSWSDSTLVHNEDETWTYVRDNTETCTFNSSGELTAVTDLNGYSETLSYTSGKLTTVTDASGRTLTFSYGDNGLVSEITDPASQHTTYGYDDSDDLTSVTDRMDRVTSYTYGDDDHLLLTVKRPNAQSGGPDAGDVLTNTYNDSDQVLTQTDPAGLETTFSYSGDNFSDDGGTTTITDPHGNVEVESYVDGELRSETNGYGTSAAEAWVYSYDGATLGETSATDPNGNTTISTYDSDGNLLTSIDSFGNTTTYTYNSLDEPLTVTDPMGVETEYTYDDSGNVLTKEVIGAGGSPTRTTTYSYDDEHAGDVTSATDPDGDVTDYTYDSYGDVATTTTNPGESTISYVQSGATNTDDGSIESGSSADILPDDSAAGDSLVALIYTFSGNDDDIAGVTGMGGVWHRGATMSNDNANDDSGVIEVWYALDVAGGSKSLTVNGAAGGWQAWVGEYSGVDPVNGFVSGSSNYGDSTSPSVSLTGSSGDLVVVGANVVSSFSSSPSSPWSEGDSGDDFNNTFGRTAAYRVLSASGSVTADWTASASDDWGAVGILLQPSGQAASGIRYVTDGSTQSGDSGLDSGQSTTVLPSDSIPGDALVAVIYTYSGNADDVSSVSGLGGDWHRAASMSNDDTSDNEGDVEVWYALDISGGYKDLNVTGATGGWIGWVGEYSGVDPTDGFVSASSDYGNSDTPGVPLTVPSGDLAVTGANTEGSFSFSPFSPWVEVDQADDFSNGQGDTAAYEVATSSGTATATWGSYTANGWAAAGVVLAPSSGSRGGGDTTEDVYDVLGRKVCEASPDATTAGVDCPDSDTYVPGTSTWSYDADSEVASETDPDGNTTDYDYDADGNQTEVTDPLGNVTKSAYDADDRVISVTQGYGTDSASTTSYTYDIAPDDCPTDSTGTTYCTESENGLSETTTSYYNALDELIEQTPPNTTDQTAATYTYDPAGNVETKTDGSGVTTYSYDADNRLVGVSYSDAPSGMSTPTSVTYAYDDDGNRTEMTDGTGTTTYAYNSLEELDSVEDGDSNTVTYGYDADGNRTCLSYPNEDSHNCADDDSGTGIVTYSYDGSGQRVSMTDWLGNTTTFSYDPDGNLTDTILPDGTNTIVGEAYDAADTLNDTSVDASGTETDLASLTRNADDLIASTTPDPHDSTTTYDYNPLNEVTTGLGAHYTYDAAGEITSSTPDDESTVDYAYNSDGQLCWTGSTTDSCGSAPSGSTTYSYDVAGDRVSSTPSGGHPTTYGFDQAGNLVCETAANASSYSCASPHSTVTSTYAYNGDGLRMSDTQAGGSEQQFTWDAASPTPKLLEDGTNFYLYAPNIGSAPIEQIVIDGSTPSYLVSDTTGVREQLDSSGSVMGSMNYTSYGEPCESCSISTAFGFEGGYSDQTGLEYLIHRYFNSGTGQFLSVDPDSSMTGQPYEYGNGDPVNNVDLDGDYTVGICASAGAQAAIFNLTGSGCLTRTVFDANHEDDIGLTGTVGGGLGVGANVAASLSYEITDATNLQQLKGEFEYATIGGEDGGGATATVFWNNDLSVVGIDVGGSIGAGADIAVGDSDTWVTQFYGKWSANIARGIWDLSNPGFGLNALRDLIEKATHNISAIVDHPTPVAPSYPYCAH
jgi:RHS repeat-associated protein